MVVQCTPTNSTIQQELRKPLSNASSHCQAGLLQPRDPRWYQIHPELSEFKDHLGRSKLLKWLSSRWTRFLKTHPNHDMSGRYYRSWISDCILHHRIIICNVFADIYCTLWNLISCWWLTILKTPLPCCVCMLQNWSTPKSYMVAQATPKPVWNTWRWLGSKESCASGWECPGHPQCRRWSYRLKHRAIVPQHVLILQNPSTLNETLCAVPGYDSGAPTWY